MHLRRRHADRTQAGRKAAEWPRAPDRPEVGAPPERRSGRPSDGLVLEDKPAAAGDRVVTLPAQRVGRV